MTLLSLWPTWLLGVLLLALAVPAAGQSEMVPNGGFESADGDGPAFWQQRTPSDGDRDMVWADASGHTGSRSLQIVSRTGEPSRWRTGHLGDICPQPDAECELTGWVRTIGVQGKAFLRLYCLDEGGEILSQPDSSFVRGDSDRTQVTLRHRVPAGTAYAMVYLELLGPGTADYDDVRLSAHRVAELGLRAGPVVYSPADFWDLRGYEIVSRGGRRVLQVPPERGGAGEADLYLEVDTARYDLTVTYLDEPDGASTLTAVLNGHPLGTRRLDAVAAGTEDVPGQATFPAVDIQCGSLLTLQGQADEGEYCRIVSVSLQRTGRFSGELLGPGQMKAQPSLYVYGPGAKRDAARQSFAAYVSRNGVQPASEAREEHLTRLQTPEDWRAYQESIRSRLEDYFGTWPQPGPLNARVVGQIDRPGFRIDKVIYEGQPGYHVTANLYIPADTDFPAPGVLFVCGHSAEGKGYHLYHECCLGLVLKGYVVLAIDPTGQGERSEYFDPETLVDLVPRTVAQHHQLGRPAFLVGKTLAGYRTWDAMRGVDYLLSRSEVDPGRLAAVGNSGGGQMAFLVTAADPRIAVCVAAHPGGSMENTYLNGQGVRDREVLSLIPPRPCRVVVGDRSGENHGHKVDDMKRICRGLGFDDGRCELKWVDGVHDMMEPKRVATYEWLNRWLGKEAAGSEEPELEILTAQELLCTPSGYALKDLGGESGQTLNYREYRRLRPQRTVPESLEQGRQMAEALRHAVFSRLGLRPPEHTEAPVARQTRTYTGDGFTGEMLALESTGEPPLPAVFLSPAESAPEAPAIVHIAQWGKPVRGDRPSLALEICKGGCPVLSVDVRGTGETDGRDGRHKASAAGWDPDNFARDSHAINVFGLTGRSLDALRALDVLRALAYAHGRAEGRPLWLVGEELGGMWALLAAACDERVAGVITVGTLLSYESLLQSPYHEVRGYFWNPGAVADFDLCELSALLVSRPVYWLDPIDAMGLPAEDAAWAEMTSWTETVVQHNGGRLGLLRSVSADAAGRARTVLELLGGRRH